MWSESGAIRKDKGGKLNVALVYPGTYHVGMSNLGFHQMYRVLNAHPLILCERFFTDAPRSVESGRPLSDFHVVAFSVSYELDAVQVVRMLCTNGMDPHAERRTTGPLVMAGGAAVTMNPEPLAPACDICFAGDGEVIVQPLYEAFSKSSSREEFLERMLQTGGVYLPSRTRPVIEGGTLETFEGPQVVRAVTETLDDPARTSVVTRDTAFGDMFLVETARGCPFSCSFCGARQIYSPYRCAGVDTVARILDEASRHRSKVGLVSTSLNTHPQAERLFEEIAARGLKLAPPSLRSGILTKGLLGALEKSGVKGVTLAPETGSETLREALGKRIPDATILEDIRALVASGVRDIKLYFMVGLPGEGPRELDATVDFVKRVRQVFIQVSRGNRRIGTVSVSIGTFVPKPGTPLERSPMITVDDARARIRRIEQGLKRESNVRVTHEGPKWSYLQAVVARGDRRVHDLLVRLAGSDEQGWTAALKRWPVNPDYFALRPRDEDEVLPWSFISGPPRGGACRGT